MIVDIWYPTSPTSTLNYFSVADAKHKSRLHQFYLFAEFLQANVKHIFFVKLDNRYREYFQEYWNYFGIPLRPKNSMYGMTNHRNIFDNEPTNWLIYEAIFINSQCKMSIYYKYAQDVSNLVVLSCVDDCIYWYKCE